MSEVAFPIQVKSNQHHCLGQVGRQSPTTSNSFKEVYKAVIDTEAMQTLDVVKYLHKLILIISVAMYTTKRIRLLVKTYYTVKGHGQRPGVYL